MGKKKKDQLVKVVAPQHVTSTDPLVISFARWKADDLPKTVTVEVLEVDGSGNDDDFKTADDVVVRYTGTLTAAPEESAQLESVKVLAITSVSRGPDRVWVRLANQKPGDVVEAGIPFSPEITANKEQKIKGSPEEFSANEGSFYELAVRVREGEGEGGEELVLSDATAIRQRAFVLLAVEPLSQNDSSMTHDAGVRILETFHPKEIKKHQNQTRKWGSTVIRLRDRQPMELGISGCSYVMTTMLLRYLRVDAAPPSPDEGIDELESADPVTNQTVKIFDAHVKFDDLRSKPQFKPRAIKQELNPNLEDALKQSQARYADEEDAFVDHFMKLAEAAGLGKKDRKNHKRKLEKFFKSKTKDKDVFTLAAPPVAENADESPFYKDPALTAESYVPLLVWRINELDDRADDYKLRRHKLNQFELQLTGAADYRSLGHGEHELWVPQFKEVPLNNGQTQREMYDHMVVGTQGKSVTNSQAILIPLAPALRSLFGVVETEPHTLVNEFTDDEPGDQELVPWQRYVVRTLDRGLPIVGTFSPGQYSLRDEGGHFCMIVGYRYRTDTGDGSKKKVRFIINDPAGGRTFQYEAHDEDELNPDSVDPTDQLKDKSIGMARERHGLNLIIERRKRLSVREIRVYEPADGQGNSAWDTARHARFLFFRGAVQSDVQA